MQKYVPLIARTFLSVIFLRSGLVKIFGFAGTQEYMTTQGIPMELTGVLLIGAIILEIAGGVSVLLGYQARWGAIALLIFLVPATLIFHTNFADNIQVIQFLKNLAIMGGLLMVVTYGSGPLSVGSNGN